jgi:phosphoglycerate dehydrogenase-like enzyme
VEVSAPGPLRVAVLDDYLAQAPHLADWESLGAAAEVTFFTAPLGERIVEVLADYDVLVLMRERTALPRRVSEQLQRLRLVVTTGMRNAALDVAALAERGVVVCGTDGSGDAAPGAPAPVEVAWALILAAAKRVTIEDRAVRSGRWQTGMPLSLAGATLSLLGCGRLGAAMVPVARAFGMDVIAWSQNLTAERAAAAGARAVERDELFARADVLSIHLVLSERTRGLVGPAELAAMPAGSILINTARGPIVDEAALIDALVSGHLGAAGLDVYDEEPLRAGHRLAALDNVVLLPHLGYVTPASLGRMYAQAVEDIVAFERGAPVRVLGPAAGSSGK